MELEPTSERYIRAAEKYAQFRFDWPKKETGEGRGRYLIRLRDMMHESITKLQEEGRHIIKVDKGYLVPFAPVRNIVRLAEVALDESGDDKLRSEVAKVKDYLKLKYVVFWRFAPYYLFESKESASKLFWKTLNELTNVVHRAALSEMLQGRRYCGCSLVSEDIDAKGAAFCEGVTGDGMWYGDGRADVTMGFHALTVRFSNDDARLVHVEHGERCSRGRILGMKYGLEKGFGATCETDKDEMQWLRCRVKVKEPHEAKALGLYLTGWAHADNFGAHTCRRLRWSGLVLAERAQEYSQRPGGCVSAWVWPPALGVWPYEGMTKMEKTTWKNRFMKAKRAFGVRETPPLITGRLSPKKKPKDPDNVLKKARALL